MSQLFIHLTQRETLHCSNSGQKYGYAACRDTLIACILLCFAPVANDRAVLLEKFSGMIHLHLELVASVTHRISKLHAFLMVRHIIFDLLVVMTNLPVLVGWR